jgi:hypothetical protein
MNIILLIIKLLHLLLIIFLLSSIFINNKKNKKYALIILIFLLLQYITNYGKCGLTQFEYLIMQENYKNGFLYRLINPIIQKDEKYIDYYYYIFHLLWILILVYQLYF